MKVSELSGALLDFWTARAEGVPAEELRIHTVGALLGNPSDFSICVRRIGHLALLRIDYSANWAMTGPLIERFWIEVGVAPGGEWYAVDNNNFWLGTGGTPLIAICRAVVRAAFGDEVPQVEL